MVVVDEESYKEEKDWVKDFDTNAMMNMFEQMVLCLEEHTYKVGEIYPIEPNTSPSPNWDFEDRTFANDCEKIELLPSDDSL